MGRQTEIADRVAFSTGFVGQRTGQEGFTASGGAGNEYIVMLIEPWPCGLPGAGGKSDGAPGSG